MQIAILKFLNLEKNVEANLGTRQSLAEPLDAKR